jgi:hypothetical protein
LPKKYSSDEQPDSKVTLPLARYMSLFPKEPVLPTKYGAVKATETPEKYHPPPVEA